MFFFFYVFAVPPYLLKRFIADNLNMTGIIRDVTVFFVGVFPLFVCDREKYTVIHEIACCLAVEFFGMFCRAKGYDQFPRDGSRSTIATRGTNLLTGTGLA